MQRTEEHEILKKIDISIISEVFLPFPSFPKFLQRSSMRKWRISFIKSKGLPCLNTVKTTSSRGWSVRKSPMSCLLQTSQAMRKPSGVRLWRSRTSRWKTSCFCSLACCSRRRSWWSRRISRFWPGPYRRSSRCWDRLHGRTHWFSTSRSRCFRCSTPLCRFYSVR